MYASSVAFVKVYRLGLTARFQVALNKFICKDTGSVDLFTREFMLMLLYIAAGRLQLPQDVCLSQI